MVKARIRSVKGSKVKGGEKSVGKGEKEQIKGDHYVLKQASTFAW